MKLWKRLSSLGLANAHMSVEKRQVFRCGQCKYEYRKAHIDSFSPEKRKLWEDIAQATDYVHVTCPQCKEDIFQCHYCPFNLCKKDSETHSICTERNSVNQQLGSDGEVIHPHCEVLRPRVGNGKAVEHIDVDDEAF